MNMLSASLRVELYATHPGIHVTVVLPGVVATDFGRNSLGGGVDNRNLPGAQPVGAAAKAIVAVIENPGRGVRQPLHRGDHRSVPARPGGLRGGGRGAAAVRATS